MQLSIEDWHDVEEIDLVTKFVRHSIGLLLLEEDITSLKVVVRADFSLINLNRWGDCSFKEEAGKNPTEFVIRVARRAMDFQRTLRVLGHEIRHVTQYTTGRLQHTNDPHVFWWLGDIVTTHGMENWFEPWEEEARGAEKGFLENFVTHYKLRDAEWYTNEP